MVMRKVRERETALISEAMLSNDEDGSGTISGTEIDNVLKMLGYDMLDAKAVDEAIRDSGINAEDEIDLSELWQFLMVYRSREGFSSSEATLIKEAFERYE